MSTRDRRTPILSVLFKFKMLCSVFEIEYCGGKTDKKKNDQLQSCIYTLYRVLSTRVRV